MSTLSPAPEPTPEPAPESTGPAVPAPRRRSAAAIVFGILTAVLAITTGGAGWLYLQTKAELDTANDTVTRLEREVTAAEAARTEAQEDLDACSSAVQAFLDLAIAAGVRGEIPNEVEAASSMLDLISACPGVKFDLSDLVA